MVLNSASVLRPPGSGPPAGASGRGGPAPLPRPSSSDGAGAGRGSEPPGAPAATGGSAGPRPSSSVDDDGGSGASPRSRGGGAQQQQPNSPGSAAVAAAGFDGKLQSLTQLFEMASSATGVDHPLCLDCAVQLKEEVEAQVGARSARRSGQQLALRSTTLQAAGVMAW